MDVRAIIAKYLTDNGFDGLYVPGVCHCLLGDLCPCGEYSLDCEPGHRMPATAEEKSLGMGDWVVGIDPARTKEPEGDHEKS